MGILGTAANRLTVSLVRLDCLANTVMDSSSNRLYSDYRCARCNTDWLTKSLLIKHLSVIHKSFHHNAFNKHLLVHQQFKLSCSTSPESYAKKCDISKHLKSQPGREKNKCEDCGRRFNNAKHLSLHLVIHRPPQFSCEVCERKFFTKNGVRFHTRAVHSEEKVKLVKSAATRFFCRLCPSNFGRVDSLNTHLINIHQPKEHNCPHCYKEFAAETELNCHMLKAHSLYVPLDFKCQICHKEFTNNNALVQHAMFHGSPTYSCSQCSLKFYSHNHLRIHVTRAHTVRVSAPVKQSNKQLKNTCAVCSKSFAKKWNLQTHLNIHYCKPQNCPVCQQLFNSDESFRRHIRINHRTFRDSFLCGICNKSFASQGYYLLHKRYHEKPTLSCPDCPQLFYSKLALFNHSTVHKRHIPMKLSNKRNVLCTESGRFGCAICSKTFSSRSLLKNHLQAHFLPLLFCSKCDFQCYSKPTIMRHLRNFHTSR